MGRFTPILFSLFLIYAGAADALGSCLGDDHHHESDHSNSHRLVSHDHSEQPLWPVIHCPLEKRVGPALQTAQSELTRPDKMTSVRASFLPLSATAALRNNLWLEALFKRILTFTLPYDLARHLSLSILQI
jgi:hypothetical protein